MLHPHQKGDFIGQHYEARDLLGEGLQALIYTAKTGEKVYCPIQDEVGEDIAATAGTYPFWSRHEQWLGAAISSGTLTQPGCCRLAFLSTR
jgi:hypothetical protein